MREPPDYEAIEKSKWLENAEKVPLRLAENEPNILKRIKWYISRFGYSVDEVKNKIFTDRMFACWFAIDVRRQSPHEKIAGEWLAGDPNISHFRSLPKSGRNAYYVTSDGEIRKGMENPRTKSVDFYWKTGCTEFFAYHKFTKEGGGNQDSQFNEMQGALERFQASGERGKVLLVIVDGPYYIESKMNDLRRFVRDRAPRSYACHIEEVPQILAEYT